MDGTRDDDEGGQAYLVPTLAVLGPDAVLAVPGVHVQVQLRRDVVTRHHAPDTVLLHLAAALHNVVDLHLVAGQRAPLAPVASGPVDDKVVGVVGRGDGGVDVWRRLVLHNVPVDARDTEVREIRHVEARGAHEQVDLVVGAVAGHDAFGDDLDNVVEHARDILLLECLEVALPGRQAAAAGAPVRDEARL